MVIRLYGMMVVLGDNGLINRTLIRARGLIEAPLPLMYNFLGGRCSASCSSRCRS